MTTMNTKEGAAAIKLLPPIFDIARNSNIAHCIFFFVPGEISFACDGDKKVRHGGRDKSA